MNISIDEKYVFLQLKSTAEVVGAVQVESLVWPALAFFKKIKPMHDA